MKCKNPHCKRMRFIPILEGDIMIGVKCESCCARYSEFELEIKDEVNREGYWNSVFMLPLTREEWEKFKEKQK